MSGRIVGAAELPLDMLAPLFEACFRQPFDAAWWRWKYRAQRNPSLALVEDGRAMAHYGGMPRSLRLFGEPVPGMQVGDVMVHPDLRGGLGRRGPFHRLVCAFTEREVGYGRTALIGFGFPNLRALRLGEALGVYATVDRVVELHWPAAAPSSPALCRLEPTDANAPAVIDLAWARMRPDLETMLAGERDAAWWLARYVGHPASAYATWRIDREEPAVVVVRPREQALEWIDFIGPLDLLPAAREAVRSLAAAAGRPEVFAWLSASAAARVHDAAAREVEIGVGVPTCVHTPGPAPEALRGRWFLFGGDTDFR
jgi:hypothetical protein